MSEKIRLDRKIGFQNMFYTKCINDRIDSIGPSIILRSIAKLATCKLLIVLQVSVAKQAGMILILPKRPKTF